MRCSHCAFLFEGQWALRSCGSPSAALQPMLCPRGLAPFYRPAIRSVQTAQELQIVRGAVLGFEEVVRAQGPRPRLAACWCQSMALKMASVRWDGGWRSLPPTPLPPGGLARVLGPITCRGLQAQDRVLAYKMHFVHPALDPAGCARGSQLTTRAIRTPPSAQAKTEPPFGDVFDRGER